MKPGKPLTFATVPHPSSPAASPLLVFGLPGNPVSALVCFYLVVAPAVKKMMGDPHPLPRRVAATILSQLTPDVERPEYHRASIVATAAGLVAVSTGKQVGL